MMKKLLLLATLVFVSCSQPEIEPVLPVDLRVYQTSYIEQYDSGGPAADELADVQCPIPMKDRVKNYTGTQCVFSSLETLARWAECKALLEPEPLTSRPGCRTFSNPNHASSILQRYGVKHENVTAPAAGLALIKKAMKEGRGALFGVPGHVMVLVHYDEESGVVKWIDNVDRSLSVQTSTTKWFHDVWNGWVMVIYAENDAIFGKLGLRIVNQIPIVDKNSPQGTYPKDYIPVPAQK